MGFFDEQRAKGPAGALAIRLEVLLIVIIVLSLGSFVGSEYATTAIVYGISSIVIPFLGFYGAVNLHPNFLLVFIIFTSFKVIMAIIFAVFSIIVLAGAFALADSYDSSGGGIYEIDIAAVVILIVILIVYSISCILSIISIVWASRLRSLVISSPLQYNAYQQVAYQTVPPSPYPSAYPPSASPYPSYPPPPSSNYPSGATYPQPAYQQSPPDTKV